MEKKISEKTIFEGRILRLIIRKVKINEKEGEREIVYHPGAVGIIAFFDNKLILVKQYRSPFEDILLEIPAGKLKKGEEPLECAKRELLEETGFVGDFEKIGEFATSPGFSNEVIHIFLCKNAKFQTDNFKKEGEIEKVVFLDLDEALKKLKNGEIKDLKTAFSITYLYGKSRIF